MNVEKNISAKIHILSEYIECKSSLRAVESNYVLFIVSFMSFVVFDDALMVKKDLTEIFHRSESEIFFSRFFLDLPIKYRREKNTTTSDV